MEAINEIFQKLHFFEFSQLPKCDMRYQFPITVNCVSNKGKKNVISNSNRAFFLDCAEILYSKLCNGQPIIARLLTESTQFSQAIF